MKPEAPTAQQVDLAQCCPHQDWLPNAYPVIDNTEIGLDYYTDYWLNCQASWMACQEKEILKSILIEEIKMRSESNLVEDYPLTTKIVEICIIGSKKY